MRFIRHTIGKESFISRIPALFPYLEWDDEGNVSLHSAAESVDGSYGRVVPNLIMPCDVSLCVYVVSELSDVPDTYWSAHEDATIGENDIPLYADDFSPLYLRKPIGYRYLQDESGDDRYEYMEELPDMVTSDSPMYVKTPYLDPYGDIFKDCDGNEAFTYYHKETDYEYYVKECIIRGGECYSYDTIMQAYYTYKDLVPSDNRFILFVQRAIGLVSVDKRFLGLTDVTRYPLVPETLYLAEVEDLYLKYLDISRKCQSYQTAFVSNGERNGELCCLCEKYEKEGGDRFRDYLKSLITKRDSIANELKCIAEGGGVIDPCGGPYLNFDVPLFHTHEDAGYKSSYLRFFEGGERYYHGEYVIYNDRTYVVQLNRYVQDAPNNYEYVRCYDDYYMLRGTSYIRIMIIEVFDSIPMSSMYNGYQFIKIGNTYYKFHPQNGYEPITVTEYTTGLWSDEYYAMLFDDTHMIPITQYYQELDAENFWYDHENVYGEQFRIFDDVPSLPSIHSFDHIRVGGAFYVWDDNLERYIPDTNNAAYYTVRGRGGSQLSGFRRFRQFVNISDIVETPEDGEDWLYYYRRGMVLMTNSISRDDHGNIQRWGDSPLAVGQVVSDLYAYGDILTDITYNRAEHSITFTYVIGGHLKATLVEISVDTDNTDIYRYDHFEHDDTDPHGVMYSETYYYDSTGDINSLIQGGEFDNYVSGNHDGDSAYDFTHYAFSVSTSTVVSTVANSNGLASEYSYIRSDFTTTVPNVLDYIYQPLYKKEYLLGYSFDADIDKDVAIDRGNGAAFEPHIRLGEIRTFEDLEDYSAFSLSEG